MRSLGFLRWSVSLSICYSLLTVTACGRIGYRYSEPDDEGETTEQGGSGGGYYQEASGGYSSAEKPQATGGAEAGGGPSLGGMGGEPTGEGGSLGDLGCLEQELGASIVAALATTADAEGEVRPDEVTELLVTGGSLQGIECLTHLQSVDILAVQPGEDLGILAELPELIDLKIVGVQDISFLKQLSQIEHLELNSGSFSDLSVVGYLKGLKELRLIDLHGLSDLDALSELDEVEEFFAFDVSLAGGQPWDSSFLAKWQLKVLWLIYANTTIEAAQLDTSQLKLVRIFGGAINEAELFPGPSGGSGEFYTYRAYLNDNPGVAAALCAQGWLVLGKVTWDAAQVQNFCAAAKN